jgi:hypothetical protein
MKARDVKVGETYWVKVHGETLVPVRILAESVRGGWVAKDLDTHREVRIRRASRLRSRAEVTDQIEDDPPVGGDDGARGDDVEGDKPGPESLSE